MRQLRFAWRMLAKTPFVTLVAVLSLGLGIGGNTAIFSLVNQILLRPLPVAAPVELVNLGSPGPKNGSTSCGNPGDCDQVFSYPMFLALSRSQQVFTGIAAHWLFNANVNYRNETLPVDGAEVSGSYFQVLGVRPALGRLLVPDDTATVGGAPVAVLSYDYWISRFDGDHRAIDQPIVVNGQTVTIVGVAPEGFDGTSRGTRVKIFLPITLRALLEPPFAGFEDPNYYWAYLFARRKPGVSLDAARSAMAVTYQQLLPQVQAGATGTLSDRDRKDLPAKRLTVDDGARGQSYIFSTAGTPLGILQLVTLVVLLIACANVANLLLARASSRAGEMAVRLSIGASRAQLVRQLLLESCLLATLGGLAGLLIMRWTTGIMTQQLALGTIDPAVSRFSAPVLLFAAVLSLGTGLVFGVFPALHATRPDLAVALKGQAGQPSGARAASRFRSTLVVVQIALSMGLLASAGLFTKSLINLSHVDLGVSVDRVATFRIDAQRNGYTTARARQLFDDIQGRLQALPGVQSTASVRVPLLANSNSSTSITVEGYVPAANEHTSTNFNEISPDYFRTVGIPLLAGRDFTDRDTLTAPKVAIVNEAFVRKFHLPANPVGHRMCRGCSANQPLDMEIVGLVKDAKYSRVRDAVPAQFFLPARQDERLGALVFYARVAGDPKALLPQIKALMASVDSRLPVQRLSTMPDQISDNTSQDRLMSTLSASFAGLATLLAAIGLYGVIAYSVSQRTREFGLRLALGAQPSGVRWLVLRQVMWLAAAGGTIGLALALGAGRAAKALLYGMSGADPEVLLLSSVALALVAFAAGFVPSLRASRVDPMRALRWE